MYVSSPGNSSQGCVPGWTSVANMQKPTITTLKSWEYEGPLSEVTVDPGSFCNQELLGGDGELHDGGWMRTWMVPSHSPPKLFSDKLTVYGLTGLKSRFLFKN